MKPRYIATALALMTFAIPVSSQAAWPEKPVTIVVPAAPGGTTDMATRLLGEKLAKELGVTIVVENRAGAGGIIGSQYVAKAAPDGYTLIMGNIGPNAINYSMYNNLSYKAEDFRAITMVISNPNILVVNDASPAHNVKELVAMIKADPQGYSFGSSGTGQSPHMSGELFKQRAGIEAQHVPYKGAGPAVTALLGNQFAFMIDNLPSSLPHIKSGKLRALAVTGDQRSSELPDIPTMAEEGIPDMVVTAWFGLFAPKGTPQDVIDKIYSSTKAALDTPDLREKYKAMGGQAGGNSPTEFTQFVSDEQQRWADIVDNANLAISN
ncbi:tripartite tricarboxylate transporter substrate binding protein [Alcaligenaceae bacterium]|nr:tripartite tricarboxylate transporter substrate binding protein [Alcaligenaceae bacterium]